MKTRLSRVLALSLWSLVLLFIFPQCAWFSAEPADPEFILPQPIGGYDALSTRIHYPLAAREQGTEGSVLVKAFVSKTGVVTETNVSEKLDPELDRIAANAVKRTLFEPARRDGEAVEVWISIPVVYALNNWSAKSSPFTSFEMIVRPSPGYQSFEVSMRGEVKSDQTLPLRLEMLLPFNADKIWIKAGAVESSSARVQDENGEWLMFQIEASQFDMGFNYEPFGMQSQPKFQYKMGLNHALPEWNLVVIYGDQNLNFTQEPSSIDVLEDGSARVVYGLKPLDAYEFRFLEVGIDQ